ncbi:MAG: sulfatase-like hydrolase/transferase [Proteobacteria bacterium]|nr:sulfatase-like hydrolase/transferase [Pseudomonadota bacterium]
MFPDDPYAGEIAFADSQLGRLLDAIERRHPDGRTLVAVTSDHGEGLGDHGEVTHSLGIYDTTQRVPLVLNGPGVPGATVVRRTVGLVDLAPTLLALVGAEPLAGTDGVDLVGSWSGDASEARPVYVETLATQIDFGWSALLGIRSGRYKYIRAPRPELYDIENDPSETRDLSAERPEQMAELSAILDERLAAAGELAPAIDPDPAARARLRELGYLAGEPAVPVELGPVGGLDPKDGMADALRLMRAMVLRGQGRPLAALGVLENIEGGGHMVNLFRSAAAVELGNAEAAERFAREAVAERPAFANGHVLLGEALAARGRAERAAASYEEALRIEPGLPAASIGLGRLAEARGDRREAARLYERAVGSRQGSAEGAWRLAALRIETGEDAAALLDEVGDLAYRDPEAALRLARAERAAGRDDAAEARLRKAFRQNRRSAALARELGAVRRR